MQLCGRLEVQTSLQRSTAGNLVPNHHSSSFYITTRLFVRSHLSLLRSQYSLHHIMALELTTGPGNPPAVRVWTAKTGRFGSRNVRKPNPLTLGGRNTDPYPSTRGFCQLWLDPSVPITGSAFRVSYLWSHSEMLLLIVQY